MKLAGFILSIYVLTTMLFLSTSMATYKSEYADAPQAVKDWYANAELTEAAKQRFSFTKCCNQAESVKTAFRVGVKGNDVWEYQKPDGSWGVVPEDVIHYGQSGPHGEAILFQLPSGEITCFFPPDGGL